MQARSSDTRHSTATGLSSALQCEPPAVVHLCNLHRLRQHLVAGANGGLEPLFTEPEDPIQFKIALRDESGIEGAVNHCQLKQAACPCPSRGSGETIRRLTTAHRKETCSNRQGTCP